LVHELAAAHAQAYKLVDGLISSRVRGCHRSNQECLSLLVSLRLAGCEQIVAYVAVLDIAVLESLEILPGKGGKRHVSELGQEFRNMPVTELQFCFEPPSTERISRNNVQLGSGIAGHQLNLDRGKSSHRLQPLDVESVQVRAEPRRPHHRDRSA